MVGVGRFVVPEHFSMSSRPERSAVERPDFCRYRPKLQRSWRKQTAGLSTPWADPQAGPLTPLKMTRVCICGR